MPTSKSLLILFPLLLLSFSSSAMRCGHNLVSIGDTSAEVLQKCGPPHSQQEIGIEYGELSDEKHHPRSETIIEQWSYDLGPGTFLKVLTFEGGRLQRIEDGGRSGNAKEKSTRYFFNLGETAAEVLKRFGPPMTRNVIGKGTSDTSDGMIEEKIELWTYAPGPGRFLQLLTFRGGRLIKVEDGARQ